MNTRTIITAAAGGILALAGIAGTVGGFATGRATSPTPEACITALADADRTIILMGDALIIAGDSLEYAATWDTVGLNQSTEDVEGITADLEAVDYSTSSAECRDGR